MANPTLKARHIYDFESEADGFRTLIGTAADGSGFTSLANKVVYWDAAGNPQEIFSPTNGAVNPRMVNSRDYAYFQDGVQADLLKWNTDIGTEEWGIDAPSTALTINAPTGGGAKSFALTQAHTSIGANAVYDGAAGLDAIVATAFVVITGFATPANNGTFAVVSSTSTSITVANSGASNETLAAVLTTENAIYPTTTTNGWAKFAHVGSYEIGSDNAYGFGTFGVVTDDYTNAGNAIDGDTSTFAFFADNFNTGGNQYGGCVWSFGAPSTPLKNLSLQILSEIPATILDGTPVGHPFSGRSAGIWYSLDSGTTWTQIYNQGPRSKQWDIIPIAAGQTVANIQVMAFCDCHDHNDHRVYEIKLLGASTGTGPITLFSGRRYYSAFNNSITGNYSDVSPISSSSGAVSGGSLPLSDIPVSTDPQVDNVYILATADGGDPSILYYVTNVANGTTTFQDGIAEPVLLLSPSYAFTDSNGNEFGLFDNTPPPVDGRFPTKHLGRIWMVKGSQVQFSKNTAELTTPSGIIAGRFEEDWPSFNVLDISEDAEQGTGLFSDGQVIYIATDRTIRRIQGDSPNNFSEPQVIFAEVGVINQDVWKTVFLEGTPVGTMWLTPDFRVILSDFNTYRDIGTPIQTTLNTINPNATANAWAMFGSQGPYGFYMLAIPTGTNTDPDTMCVFDMRLKKWYIWQQLDNVISGIYYVSLGGTSRLVFVDAGGTLRVFDPTTVVDRSGDGDSDGIPTVIQTTWMDLGDPMLRVLINEIETQTTVDDTLVSVEGASQAGNSFANPTSVIANAPLVKNLFGQLKTFTVGGPSRDRFYRITWSAKSDENSDPNDTLLGSYSIEAIPVSRI